MSELLQINEEIARKNETVILQRISDIKQSNIATHIEVSEATVTRMKDGEITRLSKLLSLCNLKVVSSDSLEIDQNELAIIHCEMVNAKTIEKDRAQYLVQRQRELITMRSADRVAKMEAQKGLV